MCVERAEWEAHLIKTGSIDSGNQQSCTNNMNVWLSPHSITQHSIIYIKDQEKAILFHNHSQSHNTRNAI